ncbi:hypothetical protein [Streptomyces purpurascens]|uniref:IPT/TIG domain-containing protein n=1 Tax=Streptomyces purpurascens TaxID=1924 RepID=A0ABZ1MGD3_STREF
MSTLAAVAFAGVLVTAGCGSSEEPRAGVPAGPTGTTGAPGADDTGEGTDSSGGSWDGSGGGSASGGSTGGGSTGGGAGGSSSSSGGSGSGGETWTGGDKGSSTWKPGRTSGGRGNGGSGEEREKSTDPAPDREFSWAPFGPSSPEWDGINTDHVYDLVQARNCPEAKRWYDNAGPRNWQARPAAWKVLEGLIAACYAVGGEEGEWQKAIDAYAVVKNQPSGDCKYTAARRTLGQLAEFRAAHPDAGIRIRPAGNGVQACPSVITGMSPRQAAPGATVEVKGTWPSAATVYADGREVRLVDNANRMHPVCCLNATVTFEVPADAPAGAVRITLKTRSVELDAGELTVTAP